MKANCKQCGKEFEAKPTGLKFHPVRTVCDDCIADNLLDAVDRLKQSDKNEIVVQE